MADDNDDSWLYGANHEETDGGEKQAGTDEESEQKPNIAEDDEQPTFDHQQFDEHNFEEAGDEEQVAAGESPKVGKTR